MPDLNEQQFSGWGERDTSNDDLVPPGSGLLSRKRKTNSRERNRDDMRAAVHAHNLAKESVALGYKTEGRLYDQDHKPPTVTSYEKSKKQYEDSQRYNDV